MSFDHLTAILILSIILQLGAAVLALRLIKMTGTSRGWNLISLALALMAFRRSSSLITLYIPGFSEYYRGMVAESIAIIISISMVLGVYFLSDVFAFRKIAESKIARSEEKLHESHKMLDTIMDSLDAIVYVADMQTHEILFMNKYTKDIFGDIVGKTCWKTIQTGQSKPCDFCTNDKLIDAEGKPTGIYEWEHYNDNVGRWYSIRDRAIPWGNGRIVRLEIAIDITKHKNDEIEHMRLLNTMKASLNEIYMFDAETLRFIYANRGALQNLGYTEQEMESMTPLDIKPELDENAFNDLIAPLVQNEKDTIEFKTVHKRTDGSTYPVEVHLQLIKNGGGPVFLAVVLDITERKQVEEELRKEQKFLAAVFDSIEEGIVSCDENGVLTRFNRATRLFHGIPKEAIPADQWAQHYDLFLPDGKTPMQKNDIPLFRALHGEQVHDAEMMIIPKKGHARTLVANGQKLKDSDGKTIGAVVAMHDITERKQAEEEIHKLNEELEQRVIERTTELEKKNVELERMNKLFVGRELRMIELKKRIAELESGTMELNDENSR